MRLFIVQNREIRKKEAGPDQRGHCHDERDLKWAVSVVKNLQIREKKDSVSRGQQPLQRAVDAYKRRNGVGF